MPIFEHCNRKKLEGALLAPAASFDGVEAYLTLPEKAAVLLYHVARNHAWPNGNKRMALVLTMLFLAINGKSVVVVTDTSYKLVCLIAGSDRRARDDIIAATATFIRETMEDVPEDLSQALAQMRASS
jgi:death-on-curing protein